MIFYRYTAWDLNGFEILKVKDGNTPEHCLKTDILGSEMRTKSGIGVGSSMEFVSEALGLKRAEGHISYHYQNKLKPEEIERMLRFSKSSKPPTCEGFYSDARTSVDIEYDQGGLSKYKITFMEML